MLLPSPYRRGKCALSTYFLIVDPRPSEVIGPIAHMHHLLPTVLLVFQAQSRRSALAFDCLATKRRLSPSPLSAM